MLFDLVSGLVYVLCLTVAAGVLQTIVQLLYFKLTSQDSYANLQQSSRAAVFALALPYSMMYVLGLTGLGKMKFEYPQVRDCFCKYHVKRVNIIGHAFGIPLMVYGWFCCFDAALPLPVHGAKISWMMAIVYLSMLKAHLPTGEWLVSVITVAILAAAATLFPMGAYGILMGPMNNCITQVTHDLYEPAYATEYERKPLKEFMHSVLEHDFYLLPLCIAACLKKIMPSMVKPAWKSK